MEGEKRRLGERLENCIGPPRGEAFLLPEPLCIRYGCLWTREGGSGSDSTGAGAGQGGEGRGTGSAHTGFLLHVFETGSVFLRGGRRLASAKHGVQSDLQVDWDTCGVPQAS